MQPYFGHFRPPGPHKKPLKPFVPVNSDSYAVMDRIVPVSQERQMISCGVTFESLSLGELNATVFWAFQASWTP